jgi:hypothetical protein
MELMSEAKLVEEFLLYDDVALDDQCPNEAQERDRKRAAWHLRISKRDVRMFRIGRAGELAMSTTIASLGICAIVQSVSEGSIEGAAISVIGILWSLGVGREAIKDLNSPDYINLVDNVARVRANYDETMASLAMKQELQTICLQE